VTDRSLGLRANSLAATVMLLVQYCLGIWTAFRAGPPASAIGRPLFSAFGAAVADGPVVLTLHALLGTLLLGTSATALVRSVRLRHTPAIALTAVALLAIVGAWVSGATYVGRLTSSSTIAMAFATALALLCYALVIFILGLRDAPAHRSVGAPGQSDGALR
jgi:hypothetical protein